MRAYGQAGHAGPSDEHTPPRLPGAGVKWSEQITPAGAMPWSDRVPFGNLPNMTGRRTVWPEERVDRLRGLLDSGASIEAAAGELGASPDSVRRAARRWLGVA